MPNSSVISHRPGALRTCPTTARSWWITSNRFLGETNAPFALEDVTAGCENEFQAAVIGPSDCVDLPRRIVESSFYRNLLRRVGTGDVPSWRLSALQELIRDNPDNV